MRMNTIIGNWKMNGSKAMVNEILLPLVQAKYDSNTRVVVCPPFPYLAQVQEITRDSSVLLGAQNLAEHPKGAYTGEVSAPMLKDHHCQYVIVGHSERRQYFNESNASILSKALLAIKYDLIPIICFGETLDQKQAGKAESTIKEQLSPIFSLENWRLVLQNVILAYEPVWAIGTGQTASPEEASKVHTFVRNLVAQKDEELAQNLPILYGGSVNPANAKGLLSQENIDGALVGGASLDANDFLEIILCNF